MADHMTAMTAEQLRAELERIAQWMHDQVETNEEQCSPGYSYRSGLDEALDAEAGKLRRLAARLSGMAADTWQPIETAPRDSRKILVGSFNVYGEWRTHLAWWRLPYEGAPDKQCSWCYDKDGTLLDASIHSCGATHWRELPAAPEHPHV